MGIDEIVNVLRFQSMHFAFELIRERRDLTDAAHLEQLHDLLFLLGRHELLQLVAFANPGELSKSTLSRSKYQNIYKREMANVRQVHPLRAEVGARRRRRRIEESRQLVSRAIEESELPFLAIKSSRSISKMVP